MPPKGSNVLSRTSACTSLSSKASPSVNSSSVAADMSVTILSYGLRKVSPAVNVRNNTRASLVFKMSVFGTVSPSVSVRVISIMSISTVLSWMRV